MCKITTASLYAHSAHYKRSHFYKLLLVAVMTRTLSGLRSFSYSRRSLPFHSNRISLRSVAEDSATVESFLGLECCQRVFDVSLPEGRCVGIQLAPEHSDVLTSKAIASNPIHWIYSALHPDEIAFAMSQPAENIQRSFLLGRLALREALGSACMNHHDYCILKDTYGRPKLPPGFIGSISHKNLMGVALVATDVFSVGIPAMGIGVDIEEANAARSSVARKVLTKHEIEQLGKLSSVTKEEEVLLRFSLKESLYKSMHPLICQYVGFQEVEVQPLDDGTAIVKFYLKTGAQENFGQVTAHWRRLNGFFLCSSSVHLKQSIQ